MPLTNVYNEFDFSGAEEDVPLMSLQQVYRRRDAENRLVLFKNKIA
jgi:hypothetical protein